MEYIDILFIIIVITVFVAIIAAIVFGAIYLLRLRSSSEVGTQRLDGSSGIGTPRRIYFYSLSFIALMMLASGVTTVILEILEGLFSDSVSTAGLASGLALVIVGLPLWWFHWRFILRALATMPAERSTILRSIYLYAANLVSLGSLAVGGYEIVVFVLRAGEFSAFGWAALPVWGAVWYFHWRIASSETPEETVEAGAIRRLYLYLASVLGVAVLASGVGWFIYTVLYEGYSAMFMDASGVSDSAGIAREAIRESLSAAIIGGAIWYSHWLRFARDDRNSTLRWIYMLLAAVAGGAISTLAGLGALWYALFYWLFGGVSDESTAIHFESVPAAIAMLSTGAALWLYFSRQMVSESVGDVRKTVFFRIYGLLLSAVGLLTLAIASIVILDTVITQIADTAPIVIDNSPGLQSGFALTLAMLLVGAPVWWIYWRRIQTAALAEPAVERIALPRKLYVLGVLCIGVLSLVGGAGIALFYFLSDLLDLALSAETLYDMREGLSVVFTVAIIIPYHWAIYRQDRQYEPEAAPAASPVRKRVTLLAAPDTGYVVGIVEGALGQPVTMVQWADVDAFTPPLDDEPLRRLAADVSAAAGASVIIVPEESGFRVISYD